MICPKCGAENLDSMNFCVNCAQNLRQQSNFNSDNEQNQQGSYQQSSDQYQTPNQYQQTTNQYQQPNQYQQQDYQNYPNNYYQQPPYQQQYPMVQPGNGAATGSLVCGIIGLFIAGLILGIIAIAQGNKAKKMGYVGAKATAGVVLGIISIVFWAIAMVTIF